MGARAGFGMLTFECMPFFDKIIEWYWFWLNILFKRRDILIELAMPIYASMFVAACGVRGQSHRQNNNTVTYLRE